MVGKPLYNSRITNTYLKLVRKKYPGIDIAGLLQYAGMEPYQVEDEGHWFSQEQVNRFQQKLVSLTGNGDIAREAGIFTASPEVMGGIRRYLLGLASPAKAYALVGRFTGKFTRSSRYESRKLGHNKIEYVVTPFKGVTEAPFQCRNRLGYLEAIARLFDYKPPKIEHPECLFKGGVACRYIVSWNESPFRRWQKIRNVVTPALVIAVPLAYFFSPHEFFNTVLVPVSISIFLLLSLIISLLRVKELEGAVRSLQESSDELIEQTNINYKNSLLINEIGQALNKELEISGLLENIAKALKRWLDYDRGLILMANRKGTRLVFQTGYGYSHNQQEMLKEVSFHLDTPGSKGMFVRSFKEKRPFLMNDIDEVKDELSAKSYEFAVKMGAKSFICCPIVYEDESLGILAVDNIDTKRPLLERDKNLLMGVANQIAISIRNAKLMDERLKQFESILEVLVASTDARDPITAGHSIRVTEFVTGICREMGLSTEYTEMIRVASLLHDYGKIGVEDEILKKPGRLSPEQYEAIKTHADKSRRILEKIKFEGIYQEVPSIVGSHHERIDGTGYPRGLKGSEIPLGSKIIAVADVFEALTSRRQYREPVPAEEALNKIVSRIGSYYDRKAVEALIVCHNKKETGSPYRYPAAAGVSEKDVKIPSGV
ncbi:MAG: HD-GYP domain-containing protein [Proteobacteria bacterium]|nr:HD-GYP domain-containing protein [Pseudomonadota bacterium]MBU1739659.1 HD-GYP domain-containing protein [Pseudomonadota bacterium]